MSAASVIPFATVEGVRRDLLREQLAIHAPACPDWFRGDYGRDHA